MASWFKAAEDLFEVVDRRAKLVVGDKQDEQSTSQASASNGRRPQEKKLRPKKKTTAPSDENRKTNDAVLNNYDSASPNVDIALDKDQSLVTVENDAVAPRNSSSETREAEQYKVQSDSSIPVVPLPEKILNEDLKQASVDEEVSVAVPAERAIHSNSPDESVSQDSLGVQGGDHSPVTADGVELVNTEALVDSESSESQDISKPTMLDKEKPQPESVDSLHSIDRKPHDVAPKVETNSNELKQKGHENESFGSKVQEQLDEAQGLLNTAVSTGQSKEARLARVCAGLSTRLQEYKSENAQLEELLMAERELSKSYEGRINQLEKKLSATKVEVAKVELNMTEALDAKNSEIAALVSSMDMLRKQAALSEGNLASIQANMESIMRNKELTETRMMQALREELASVERRAEEERAAHNATKMAAMEREVELEHRSIEASTALARVQRIADDRTAKVADLEQKLAVLEVEYASLNQEMQDMETRAQHRQKKSPEDPNQVIQIQAWKEEVERARQSQRDAESKLSSVEAEMQKLRVEMASMKRDAEHYSRQEHMELEKRYRELTDLLYYKQTQLETMASEKAAVEFQLEKEIKSLREDQVEASRSRATRRQSATWEEDADMKALEPLPIYQRHMAGATIQLQKAAKILDTGAARATRFLWRYPTARLILLFYLVFVHLFLMYLLHCLQEQADTFTSREVAETMGLGNHTLQ